MRWWLPEWEPTVINRLSSSGKDFAVLALHTHMRVRTLAQKYRGQSGINVFLIRHVVPRCPIQPSRLLSLQNDLGRRLSLEDY